MNSQLYTGLEVAIVGISCRMPGAGNWREYWDNLVHSKETIHFYSDEELVALGIDPVLSGQPDFIKAGGRLDNKDRFDSAFFNYTPDEARLMNPEHRILHECAWEALEDAGIDAARAKGLIGLFAAGSEDLNWKAWSLLANREGLVNNMELSYINNKDYMTALLSYKLDLRGPSFSLHTACSGSLVAVHLACRSLLLGELNIALAGGITVRSEKKAGYIVEEGGILSADGHCRVFDEQASGTISSEGAGLVVLRRLKDALQDRDHIYAIIKGSAMNNDGNRKVGFTAPSVEGQADCIRAAQKFAKVAPETIGYIEAHGTGTRLGDPIEIAALNRAFDQNRTHRCAIGSVKSNIGHTDSAAGVAGLIKTALSLQKKMIPPSLHYTTPNPEIDFANGPFYVNTTLKKWQRENDTPLRAGVSSFGIGGTNAHLILEEAPAPESLPSENAIPAVITLSAKSEKALLRSIDDLNTFAGKEKDLSILDLSYTLQTGRRPFSHRIVFTCNDREELLHLSDTGTLYQKIRKMPDRRQAIVFLFPGQGSQYIRMGKGLYDHLPLFRQEMDQGFELLQEWTGRSYKNILFPEDSGVYEPIDQTLYTQPILFLFEYALAKTLLALGVTPDYMAGHSIGEYVAACISGLFSLQDGLRLVTRRAALMNELSGGTMLSAAMQEEEARFYLDDRISLAAVNGPEQVVFSGDRESIEILQHRLEAANTACLTLHTSHAFHSHMLDAILETYHAELATVAFGQLKYPWLSNLTGTFIEHEQAASAEYWVNHMRQTVRFSDGIKNLLHRENDPLFIELGPGRSLTKLVQEVQQHRQSGVGTTGFNMIRRSKENIDDLRFFSDRLGELWTAGLDLNWSVWHAGKKRNKLSLPTYPFESSRYPAMVDPLQNNTGIWQNNTDPWQNILAGSPAPSSQVYLPGWKSNVLAPTQKEPTPLSYVLLASNNDFCRQLKTKLAEKGPTAAFERGSSLTPAELEKELSGPVVLIYTWCLDKTAGPAYRNYFGLIEQFRAMRKSKRFFIEKIIILTDSLQNVTGSEQIDYNQSPVLALANAFPQEYGIRSCVIDLLLDNADHRDQAIVLEEIQNGLSHKEQLVAIRHGRRWIRDFQRETVGDHPQQKVLRENGLYLLTGGSGKIGRTLVEYLVTNYHARIVLTGRREWPGDKLPIEGTVYRSTDVSDREQFRQTIEEIEQTMGRIDGVIHAAGNIDSRHFEWVEDISEENTHALFAPKVQGIENIYQVFRNRNCDFVWITSSLATQLGGLGFSSYAAANLYMDYFLQAKTAELNNWKCIGLSELSFTTGLHRTTDNRPALDPPALCRLFEWSLTVRGQPLLLQTSEDLSARMTRAFSMLTDLPPGSGDSGRIDRWHDNPNPTEKQYRERDSSSPYQAPETNTEKELVQLLENFFGLSPIGVADNFFELGGDSLKAMVLLKKIQKDFDVQITLKDFFGYQNIREIAGFIEEKIWLDAKTDKKYNTII